MKQAHKSIAAAAILTLAAMPAYGASLYWDGNDTTANADGGVGSWDSGVTSNWDDAATSGAAATWTNGNHTAIFGGPAAGAVTLASDVVVGGMSFTANGYSVAPGVGPYEITLAAAGSTGSLTSGSIYTSTGTTTISANIDNAGYLLSVVGPGNTNISGDISGSGGITTVYGGTLTLSGDNTYTGKTSISANTTTGSSMSVSSLNSVATNALLGTVHSASSSLGAPTTLENGTITIGSGGKRASCTLIYTGDTDETTDRVINLAFNSSSSQTINVSGDGLLKFTSAMTANTGGSTTGKLILDGTGDGEIVQALPTLPTGGLEKKGAGRWTLDGDNVYTSPTTVSGGALIVNGDTSLATGAVTVSNANTALGGSGIIGGSTTMNTGTILSPGTSPGTITFNQDLSLAGGAGTAGTTVVFEAGDLVDVNGTLTLNSGWNLNVTTGFQSGGSVTLFTFGTAGVTFSLAADITDNTGLGLTLGTLQLQQVGNTIVLNGVSVVPEPTTLGLLGLGAVGLMRRRRVA